MPEEESNLALRLDELTKLVRDLASELTRVNNNARHIMFYVNRNFMAATPESEAHILGLRAEARGILVSEESTRERVFDIIEKLEELRNRG